MNRSTREKNPGNVTNVENGFSIETGGRLMYANVQEERLSRVKYTDNSSVHNVIKYLRKLVDLKNMHNPGIWVIKNQKAKQDQYRMPNAMNKSLRRQCRR